jgi:hypothetical protein
MGLDFWQIINSVPHYLPKKKYTRMVLNFTIAKYIFLELFSFLVDPKPFSYLSLYDASHRGQPTAKYHSRWQPPGNRQSPVGWGDAGFFSPGLQNSNLVCYQGASTSSKEQEMRRDILHLPTHELGPIGTAGIDLSTTLSSLIRL